MFDYIKKILKRNKEAKQEPETQAIESKVNEIKADRTKYIVKNHNGKLVLKADTKVKLSDTSYIVTDKGNWIKL